MEKTRLVILHITLIVIMEGLEQIHVLLVVELILQGMVLVLNVLYLVILVFMLAMLLFAGVRERMETADVPEFLKGLPITLVAAALVSLSFLGFAGIGG